MKQIRKIACIAVMAVMVTISISLASGDITLLLIPRENEPVRMLGKDIGSRFPTLLLTYKILPNAAVSLHGWSGTEWVNVTQESYESGSFFPQAPSSAILVSKDGEQIPSALIPSEEWCPEAYIITTTEIRPLLHLIGRQYNFHYDDWKWFVQNYRLPMSRINPDALNVHWYHQRLGDNLKQRNVSGEDDLHYLSVLFTQQPVVPHDADEPMPMDEEQIADPASAIPEQENDSINNPLTNAVPDAVILGAADANETVEEGSTLPVEEIAEPEANE